MAILEGLEGIEVTVCVDGQALHEYNDDEAEAQPGAIGAHQASKTVSKYVEAVTGKEFSIKTTVKSPYKLDCPALTFHIKIDGSTVSKPLLLMRSYRAFLGWEQVTSGIKHHLSGASRRCSIQHFRFTEIHKTEDHSKLASLKEDAEHISGVGEISIHIFRKSEPLRSQKTESWSLQSRITDSVHEKALRGQPKSHTTSLGAAQHAVADFIYTANFLDGADHPMAIFKFKYRSREALKSLLILRRSPEPEPEQAAARTPFPTADPNDDDLTTEMKRKLEEFKKSLVEAKQDAKLKSESPGQNPSPRVKHENPDEAEGRPSSKRPKYKTIIDLTEDDDEGERIAISLDD